MLEGSNYQIDFHHSSVAQKVYNENGKLISQGNEKSRFHIKGLDNKVYWIALESSLKERQPLFTKVPRLFRRTAILTLDGSDGEKIHVEVNIRSVSKRLGISLKEIKEEMDRQEAGHSYGDITALIKRKLDAKVSDSLDSDEKGLLYLQGMKLINEKKREEGIEKLRQAAVQGYREANYQLAIELQKDSPNESTQEIKENLFLAADQGHPLAAYECAIQLPEKDPRVNHYLNIAAKNLLNEIKELKKLGVPIPASRLFPLADILMRTGQFTTNSKKMCKVVLPELRRLSRQSEYTSLVYYLIGKHYETSQPQKAFKAYDKAINRGNVAAKLAYYHLARETGKNQAYAFLLIQEAAKNDQNSMAKFELGRLFAQGWILPGTSIDVDPKKAEKWLQEAKHDGNQNAVFELGLLYLNNDATRAFECFQEAAKSGNREGSAMAGFCLLNADRIKEAEVEFKKDSTPIALMGLALIEMENSLLKALKKIQEAELLEQEHPSDASSQILFQGYYAYAHAELARRNRQNEDAFNFYQRAMECGNAEAFYSCGMWLFNGEIPTERLDSFSPDEFDFTLDLIIQSAELGHVAACRSLKKYYSDKGDETKTAIYAQKLSGLTLRTN